MNSGTLWAPLKFCADVSLGKTVQGSQKTDDERFVNYVRAASIQLHGLELDDQRMWMSNQELITYDLRRDDVLIVEGGAGYGRSVVLDEDMPDWGFQNHVIRVRPMTGWHGRYLNYVMKMHFNSGLIEILVNGATIPALSSEKARQLEVPFISESQQRAIADYLDRETGEIDAMIAKLDEMVEVLEERRKAAVTKVLDASPIAEMVPLNFVASGGDFFDGDWVESKDQDPDGDIRLLQLADVGVGRFLDKSNRWINQEAFTRLKCREVIAGDLLIARMPDPLGRACVLPEGLGRTITVVDVAVCRPDPSLAEPRFLAYAINSQRMRSLIESLQGGSTRQRIPRSVLGQQRLSLPPLSEQYRIADHLDEVTGRIDAMLEKVVKLKELLTERRAALITDVVTGRKEVA